MFYRMFFDGSMLDLHSLTFDKDGRPIKGFTVNGEPVWIGTFKFVLLMPDPGEELNLEDVKRMGF